MIAAALRRGWNQVSKRLHEPKQVIKTWSFPLRRRIPISLETPADRRAFMLFDPRAKHGGWIDRVKGIISVYELSLLSGRTFQFSTGSTFPITEFLAPAGYDWHIQQSDVSWNPLHSEFHVSRDHFASGFPELLTSTKQTLFVETNLDYLSRLHTSMPEPEVQALWGRRFRELFTVRPHLQREIEAHTVSSSIAVHARFTALLGDFKDGVDNALAPREREALLRESVARVATIAREHSSRTVVVFSDSTTFLQAATSAADNIVTIAGTPTHIDEASHMRESLRKTLLDFYVMQRCESISLLRIGPMYNSAFSRYASYVAGIPFAIIR